jgi:cytochrome oxidase assembly protein ShyY1
VLVSGEFDFFHEVVIRNRKFEGVPGVMVLTPIKIIPSLGGTFSEEPHLDKLNSVNVMVSRGFIPLNFSSKEKRSLFQQKSTHTFTAIIKESAQAGFFSPKDPPAGPNHPWVDEWLRFDIEKIGSQIPYKLLPYYLEIIPDEQINSLKIVESRSEREEMLSMASRRPVAIPPDISHQNFPKPAPSAIVPAGRHKQYIFEWIILSLLTVAGSLILMLRPPRHTLPNNTLI